MEEALRICKKYGCELWQWEQFKILDNTRVRSSAERSVETELTSIGGLLRGEPHSISGVTAGETAFLEEKEAQSATTVSGQKELI